MAIKDIEPGEEISFSKSKIKGAVSSIQTGSSNITTDYTFETGQRPTFYGYSSIVRKPGVDAPSRKLKVYFARGTYDSSDTGDITTVNSYNGFNYAKENGYTKIECVYAPTWQDKDTILKSTYMEYCVDF